MRILVVCGAGYMYGRENVTLSVLEGLKERGHDVMCLTSTWSNGDFERRLNLLSIPNQKLPFGFISKTLSWTAIRMTLDQLLRLVSLWLGFKSCLRNFKPDIILHTNFHHIVLLWPLLGRQLNVFHVHEGFAPTPFYSRLFRVLSRRIAMFVGVSSYVANTLLNLGLPQNKVTYVLNGVAPYTWTNGKPKNNGASHNGSTEQPGKIRIGIVGQISEWKGHEDLIDALRLLKENRQMFVCRLFGTGSVEFTARLKTRIEQHNLTDQVEWMGFESDRSSIYDKIDICVVPSRFAEPFGMVAAEAAMHGLPVIASRRGGLAEIIVNEQTGYIIDAESPEQIAEKICVLSTSSARRSEMGRRAKSHAIASFSAERMIDQIEALFRENVGGRVSQGMK